MWRNISLRHRLNLMFATLLLLWLAADIGLILANAGPRVQAEARSVSRLTQEFIEISLARIQDAPNPEQAVIALVSSLQFLRHVRVGLGENALASAMVAPSDQRVGAPEWFRALVHSPSSVTTIPVVIKGRRLDSIIIVADPSDVVYEVWLQARTQVVAGGALALAVIVATGVFVRGSLRPLGVAGARSRASRSGRLRRARANVGIAGIRRYLCEDQSPRRSALQPERRQSPIDRTRARRSRRGTTGDRA